MYNLVWLVPLLPLAGFVSNGLGRNVLNKAVVNIIGCGSVLGSFIVSLLIFLKADDSAHVVNMFDWIEAGSLKVSFSFYVDHLSLLMMLIVTGVGSLIHIYSTAYMKHDPGYAKYFAFLNLFMFSMLMLILASNYVLMFVGWEGVGLCSYLLIGFWFKNPEYTKAANKAFVMNRIGDLGFMAGIFLIFQSIGTTEFAGVFEGAKAFSANDNIVVAITLCLFIGACGKSAQIPLYTWLPDAMAGPTPVSALIHAATMVTAGIYMIVRSNVLFSLAPFTLSVIAVVGLCTALLSALIALTQNDIKKVLAYSTVSQLGYMFVALGVGAFSTAMFHVTTHAFFKACLFLGAGSVIHGMGGEQNMRHMGNLRGKMKITFITMTIATLAIIGCPPFAGFFSKDEILAKVFVQQPVLFFFLACTSVLTAIYMLRMLYMTFFGRFRGTHHQEEHVHESPAVMTFVLVILAVCSALAGFLGIPEVFKGHHIMAAYLQPVVESSRFTAPEASTTIEWIVITISIVTVAVIYVYARNKYSAKPVPVEIRVNDMPAPAKWSYNKFYVDELYNTLIVNPVNYMSRIFYTGVEKRGINALVNSVGDGVVGTGGILRLLQTGNLGFYMLMMALGLVAILASSLLIH